MARIPLVDPDDAGADPLARETLKRVTALRNRTVAPNVYAAVANHPEALHALADFGTTVYYANSLTLPERELAYLTASLINECHY